MIVGGSKKAVIDHIRDLANNGELNHKAELDDPSLSDSQSAELISEFYRLRRQPLRHFLRRRAAYLVVDFATRNDASRIEIVGLDKLKDLKKKEGAIVTSNHFNPIDTIIPRRLAKKLHRRLYIVSQETNLALPKPLNFITNNTDLIPLTHSPNDIAKRFKPDLAKTLQSGHLVLIYPEEEMWFNYRKPRPCRRGAYQFAAECNAPVISCFTELRATKEPDNEEFYKLKYKFHILGILRPDHQKSPRENSIALAEQDYALKIKAYEAIYGQKLQYKFDESDIAGWRG